MSGTAGAGYITRIVRITSGPVLVSGLWCPECGGKVGVEADRSQTSQHEMDDGHAYIGVLWECQKCDSAGKGWIRAAYEEIRLVDDETYSVGIAKE